MVRSIRATLAPHLDDAGRRAVAEIQNAAAVLGESGEVADSVGGLGEGRAHDYLQATLSGRRDEAIGVIRDAMLDEVDVADIMLDILAPAQIELGRLWERGEISIAHEHYTTAITQLSLSLLYPRLLLNRTLLGRSLVATSVGSEAHEVGIRMIADLMEQEGWRTTYLGADLPHAEIIDSVAQHRAEVLAVSATMAGHIRGVRELIAALRADPRCRNVRVLVGGRPFTLNSRLAADVGADGWAPSARGGTGAVPQLDGGPGQCLLTNPRNELLLRELGRINSELASQRRLNAMTVHDLSNPAQVILGLSEVLLEHQVLDPMVRKHLEQLHRSALTMTALITDLNHGFSLDDQDSLELERLDLVELVASVVERTHRLADAKDMRLPSCPTSRDHRAAWSTATRSASSEPWSTCSATRSSSRPRGRRSPSRSTAAPTSPRSPSATRARASARRARRASSTSSTARTTPRTCRGSASGCSSPSRSRRATAAPSASSPSTAKVRPSCCRCRWPWTCWRTWPDSVGSRRGGRGALHQLELKNPGG